MWACCYANPVQIALGLIDGSHTVHNGDCILRTSCDTFTRSSTFFPINHYFHFTSTYPSPTLEFSWRRALNPNLNFWWGQDRLFNLTISKTVVFIVNSQNKFKTCPEPPTTPNCAFGEIQGGDIHVQYVQKTALFVTAHCNLFFPDDLSGSGRR